MHADGVVWVASVVERSGTADAGGWIYTLQTIPSLTSAVPFHSTTEVTNRQSGDWRSRESIPLAPFAKGELGGAILPTFQQPLCPHEFPINSTARFLIV